MNTDPKSSAGDKYSSAYDLEISRTTDYYLKVLNMDWTAEWTDASLVIYYAEWIVDTAGECMGTAVSPSSPMVI